MLHTVEEWTLLGRYALNTLTDNAMVIDTMHTFAMPLRHLLYCLHNYQAVAKMIPIEQDDLYSNNFCTFNQFNKLKT